MTAFHPLLKFKLGHYQIVTRRFAEFSAQKAAREAHQNDKRSPGLARGYRGARFLTPAASLDLLAGHAGRRGSCAVRSLPGGGKARRSPAFQRVHRQERRDLLRGILAGRRVRAGRVVDARRDLTNLF
jgi:hypothetical protein